MQVKIFSCTYTSTLEGAINDFIMCPSIKVIDIKFSTGDSFNDAMIIYEEKKATE